MGIANQRSIAYAVARGLSDSGADLALTYAPDTKGRFEKFVRGLQDKLTVSAVLPLDVREDKQWEDLFGDLDKVWSEGFDFVLHSVAYAERDDLEKGFSSTSREGWMIAQDVSAYSLLPLSRLATERMKGRQGGGSLVSMSFIGALLAVPNYNVMGPAKAALEAATRYLARQYGTENIRFNCVSAGALRTLSSMGVNNFSEMLQIAGDHSALERNILVGEIANAALFLLSDISSGVTGQTLYVDGGFNVMAN